MSSDVRRRATRAGGVEQEPTEGTETDSILCFLCYLLLNSEAGSLASVDADFISCVSRGWRVPSPRSDIAGRHCVFAESDGPEILSDELLDAEPDRCTEPPFALGTGALEFWSFDKSGLGGR